MKKIVLYFMTLLMIILSFITIPVSAKEAENEYVKEENNGSISYKEAMLMQEELKARNLYSAELSIEPLYDANGEASFLMGSTDLGYAIMERNSGIVYECGEASPFCGFKDCKKFYGGVMLYYVKKADKTDKSDKDVYCNIMTGESEAMPLPYISTASRGEYANASGNDQVEVRLENERYITQYAFGYNKDGTCNQVAFAIALNYLRLQRKYPVINTYYIPELFLAKVFPEKYHDAVSAFPCAEDLHQKVRIYFEPSIFAWGNGYCNAANNYLTSLISNPDKCPGVYCNYLPSYTKIATEIASKRPLIVSTWTDPNYSFHTMAAYGIRFVKTSNGYTPEVLVHVGWYRKSFFRQIGGRKFEQKDQYVNLKSLTYGYFFTTP